MPIGAIPSSSLKSPLKIDFDFENPLAHEVSGFFV